MPDITSSQFVIALLTMVAVTGTIFTLVMPLFERDRLKSRMKTVALERDKMRAQERARLATEKDSARASLRMKPKANIQGIVDRLSLQKAFADENTKDKLRMAGYRGPGPFYTYLVARLCVPAVIFVVALLYALLVLPEDLPTITKVFGAVFLGMLGTFFPNLYVKNQINKRQLSIRRAWPDALDLSLICIESGMSVEAAFHRVADEIGSQSIPLAEELTLTNAELSYLSERRQAYENLSKRTGVDGVKNVMMALIQAERYGTSVGNAIRTMSEDNREERMQEAEKKAAALPPKLTVPMILFFLPVIFAVVLTPAIIQVMDTFQ